MFENNGKKSQLLLMMQKMVSASKVLFYDVMVIILEKNKRGYDFVRNCSEFVNFVTIA